jgi:hypothetical protein
MSPAAVLFLTAVSAHAQTSVVATFRIRVAAEGAAPIEGSVSPAIERLNGSRATRVGPEFDGKILEIAVGTYVFLESDPGGAALNYALNPALGILETPPGRYRLPSRTVGFLKAVNTGTVTITVRKATVPSAPKPRLDEGLFIPNWSGYMVTGPGGLHAISGNWTVPAVYDTGASAESAAWIGIDGGTNLDLIQIGTESDWSGGDVFSGGGPHFYAWWEILPSVSTTINQPIYPGDQMSAFISQNGDSNQWTMSLTDVTQNWTFTTVQTYSAPNTSAEWIVEDPRENNPFGGSYMPPLANFNQVSFDQARLNYANPQLGPIESITMVQNGATVASPSNPDGDGDGFSVAFGASTPPPPGPLVTTTALPNAVVGHAYNAILTATGSGAPFIWGISSGGLPAGLNFNNIGAITGTPAPSTSGTYSLSVLASSAANLYVQSAPQPLTLTVLATEPPPVSGFGLSISPGSVNWTQDAQKPCAATFSVKVTPQNGFNGSVALSVSGLPAGVTGSFTPTATKSASTLRLSSPSCPYGGASRAYIQGSSGTLSSTTSIIIDLKTLQPPPPR